MEIEKLNKMVSKYLDTSDFTPDISIDAYHVAATNDIQRIIYTDTDSSFTALFKLISTIIENEFKISTGDFFKMIIKFSENTFDETEISKQIIIDIVQIISAKLEDFINIDVLRRFGRAHGVEDSHNYLDFKQEFIFSAIYIVAKKNYVYRYIAEKGVADEGFDYLNIGVKSDKAAITNKVIQYISKLLLLEETYEPAIAELYRLIQNVKLKIQKRDADVSIPASLSKTLDEYKKNMMNPRGALLYECLTDNKGIFKAGTKGNLLIIKQIYWQDIPNADARLQSFKDEMDTRWGIKDVKNRMDVILVPETEDINDVLKFIDIDEQAQLIKLFLKPLKQLLEPIGIDVAEIANIDDKKLLD